MKPWEIKDVILLFEAAAVACENTVDR